MEGVELGVLGLEAGFVFGADGGAGQQAGIGGLRSFVMPHGFAAAFLPARQFEAGTEVVLEPAPFLRVEFVHQADEFGVFEAVMAKELAHMRPVLLFDVGVVIFAIGAAAGKGHRPPLPPGEMLKERPVEELAAVVGMEAFQGKGQAGFPTP